MFKRITTLFLCGTIASCANLTAVNQFATQTKTFTALFPQMATDTLTSCKELERIKAIDKGSYDAAAQAAKPLGICATYSNIDQVSLAAHLLDVYAEKLAAVSSDKIPDTFSEDISSLQTPLKEMLPQAKVDAISSFVDVISKPITSYFQKRAIVKMLGAKDAVNGLVMVLDSYVQGPYLTNQKALQSKATDYANGAYIDDRYVKEPLARGQYQEQLLNTSKSAAQKQEAAKAFHDAATKLVAANNDLSGNLNDISSSDRFKAVKAFADQVKDLNTKLKDAF